jgi:hypothetical protein
MRKFNFYKRLILISLIHVSALSLAAVPLNSLKKPKFLQTDDIVKSISKKIDLAAPKPQFRGKTILCDDTKVQRVKVTFGRLTILNFPAPPKDILPGEVVFDFKQIRNELAIKALRPAAKTNVGIYLQDRRCSFELVTVPSGGDEVLFVRDPTERQIEVKYHE